ncbi:MAG TPA: cytochrome c oxidase subunit 3 [Aliidongia sp.]|uniref:cytochrome c oxidase subunit 3 n=1 Tax=Aliidongia sp. TaxID=1914230 RepID=UPI002DDC9A9C|nr:cytochrome c oxidase subunit 3 [Aliidongia sp.]HEV2676570.1 cytochrome c oxidase subunit 3 [Aliidongia sp.]
MSETTAGHPKHQFHLVAPSIWPLISSLSAGAMFGGTVLGLHGHGWILAEVGFMFVLFCMFMWWRDVIKEAVVEKHHTPIVQIGLRYGMTLFISSEVMFFVAFFWAFFASSLYPVGGVWPPKGITPFDPFHLPFLNTLILLLSGTTVTWAHHSLIEGDRKGLLQGLGITVLLGLTFTCLQAIEYGDALFTFDGNIFGATFFMATGFHGFHVMVGTIFLAVCWVRAYKGQFKPDHHFGFEAAAWYWHFVDVVWLFLFLGVYVWGGHGIVPPAE